MQTRVEYSFRYLLSICKSDSRHIPDKNVCVGTASLTSAGFKQGCSATAEAAHGVSSLAYYTYLPQFCLFI